jgi:hypothetical protein
MSWLCEIRVTRGTDRGRNTYRQPIPLTIASGKILIQSELSIASPDLVNKGVTLGGGLKIALHRHLSIRSELLFVDTTPGSGPNWS